MKESKLLSIVLMMIISLSVIFIGKDVVMAADDNSTSDLTRVTNSSSSGNSSSTNSSSNANSSSSSANTVLSPRNTSVTANTTTRNTSVANTTTASNTSTGNTVLRTGNATSSYNNTSTSSGTNLPKTGAEDTLPIILIIAVLGASAVFAYKKIQDYNKI